MALTLASAARLLSEHGLLREIIQGDAWTLDAQTINGFDKPFGSITYDTRQVVSGALLCCKGRFKAEYLDGIDDRGLAAYVAENDFSAATKAPGLIVNDARKAMQSAVRGILWVPAEPTESHRHYRNQGKNHYRLSHSGYAQRLLLRQMRFVLFRG